MVLAAALAGCESDTKTPPSAVPADVNANVANPGKPELNAVAPAAPGKVEEPKKLDIAGAKLADKEIAEIKTLKSDADQKLALEQKLCPVSGAHLGKMGTPIKVVLKDKPVFLCCDSCEDEAKAKPDATLAKIGR
jgi:hypothetical protein